MHKKIFTETAADKAGSWLCDMSMLHICSCAYTWAQVTTSTVPNVKQTGFWLPNVLGHDTDASECTLNVLGCRQTVRNWSKKEVGVFFSQPQGRFNTLSESEASGDMIGIDCWGLGWAHPRTIHFFRPFSTVPAIFFTGPPPFFFHNKQAKGWQYKCHFHLVISQTEQVSVTNKSCFVYGF